MIFVHVHVSKIKMETLCNLHCYTYVYYHLHETIYYNLHECLQ